MNLKFYTSVAKGLKLKVRKFLGLVPSFVEVTGEKLVGRAFLLPCPLPPILNRVNCPFILNCSNWVPSYILPHLIWLWFQFYYLPGKNQYSTINLIWLIWNHVSYNKNTIMATAVKMQPHFHVLYKQKKSGQVTMLKLFYSPILSKKYT